MLLSTGDATLVMPTQTIPDDELAVRGHLSSTHV